MSRTFETRLKIQCKRFVRDVENSRHTENKQIHEILKQGEKIFSITDINVLYNKYLDKIKNFSNELCNEKFSYTEKILNLLEYIRMKGMYENHSDKESNILSQSGLNIALLNKGVCASQSAFMSDILEYSGIGSERFDSKYADEENNVYGGHGIVMAESEEYKTILWIDPTWYNGFSNSLKGSLGQLTELQDGIADGWKSKAFSATQNDIEKCRKNVMNLIRKEVGIDNIIEKLDLKNRSKEDAISEIINFLNENEIKYQYSNGVRSVLINGEEFEFGKAMELFLNGSDIQYELTHLEGSGNDKKYNIGKILFEYEGIPTEILFGAKGVKCTENEKYKQHLLDVLKSKKTFSENEIGNATKNVAVNTKDNAQRREKLDEQNINQKSNKYHYK